MELITTVVYEWKLFSHLLLQRHDSAWESNLLLKTKMLRGGKILLS